MKLLCCVFLQTLLFTWQAWAQGTGLTGFYFKTNNFTGVYSNRVDAGINFDWGAGGSGISGFPTNNFSVRWTGQLQPIYNETYTFYVTADDGAALWVDNRLVASRLFYSTNAQVCGQVTLTPGKRVNIMLEYFETTSNANVRLEWASPTQSRQIIPASQLYTNIQVPECGTILEERWLNLAGTAVATLTNSPNYPQKPNYREILVSFECFQTNYGSNFGTRVVGYIEPRTNGNYQFAIAASDAAQLWLGTNSNPASLQLVASVTNATAYRDWSNQVSQISSPLTLQAYQKYYVELRHKAGTNANHFSTAWLVPGSSTFNVIGADYLVPIGLTNSLPSATNIFNTIAQSHPQLLASAERFAWLAQQITNNPNGQQAQWFANIYSNAVKMLTQPPVVHPFDGSNFSLYQSRTNIDRMYTLGLAWKISGDTNFANCAWTNLNAVANFPDWDTNDMLATAEMTHSVAIGYDWFYEYLTPTQRTFLLASIVTNGLTPALSMYNYYMTTSDWLNKNNLNNVRLVYAGGFSLGALAVGTNSTIAAQVLTNAITVSAATMQHWTTDNGAWFEGPDYWNYAADYNFRMLAGLQTALGSDFGLSATSGLNNGGLFTMLLTSANLQNFNFADGSTTSNYGGPQLMFWGRRFDVPGYFAFERTNNDVDVMGDLWWDSRGGDPMTENIGSDNVFLGATGTTPFNSQHIGVLRSSWNDSNETFLPFKGGEMGVAVHSDLDAGTFVLDALGQRWAYDLGKDNYNLNGYFDPNPAHATNRWDYYRMRAEGQNTLVINPGNGPDTKIGPVAPVINFQSRNGVQALSVIDLTPVETNVVRAWRGFQLLGPQRKQVLIQDEIAGGTNANVWWFMHYSSSSIQVALSSDGTIATMTQGTNRLWCKILGSGGTFQIMNAQPLATSPNPAGQDPNSLYQKLAIHLTGVSNTTVAVWFVPLAPGQNPPVVPPTLTPLAQWQIPETNPPVLIDGYLTTPQNTVTNIDLASLVSSSSTPASNLVYSISAVTNGIATLLPDGHTAQFTPATNFYGSGQFLYTATDAAGNSATAGVVITVPSAAWYWDTATTAGLQPGNGNWDGTSASWSATINGSNPLLIWPSQGNDANFIGTGGTYAISISGTQMVNQIVTSTGNWSFTGGALNHASGPMTVTANADTTLNSPLTADTDFTVLGTNRLTLGATAIFSGNVFVPSGTLRCTANNTLPATSSVTLGANTTAGALDFSFSSQTFSSLSVITTNSALTNLIAIGGGQTLLVVNSLNIGVFFGTNTSTKMKMTGGGSLVFTNAGQNFTVGNSISSGNSAVLDCSQLGSVTLGTSNSPLGELQVGYGLGSGPSSYVDTLTLSDTNNTITAATVQVGNSIGNQGTYGALMLGAGTNFLAADTFNIGLSKVAGTVRFASQTAGSPGTVTIGGKTGSAADIWIGYKNAAGTSANPTSILDLRGHIANVTADSLAIAVEDGSSTGGEIGSLYFDSGNFTATNVTIAAKSGTSTGAANGSLNINGGTFTVFAGGSFSLASQSNTGTASGTLNLTGGSFNSYVDILDGGGAATSTLMLNGGTLNMFGHNLGSATNINSLNLLSGTLQNVGDINAGSPLVKTGTGTLNLSGTNLYRGATTISTGELMEVTPGSCSNSAVAVLAGATNGVQIISPNSRWVCASLTNYSGSCLDFNFGSVSPSSTIAPLQIFGTCAFTNPVVIVHTSAGITNGQYPLIGFNTLAGTVISNLTFIPPLSANLSWSLITNGVRSSLDLVIVSSNNTALTWAAGNGNWDINTSANWQNGGYPGFNYQDGKSVIFDDSASGASPILVTNTVTISPSSVLVNVTNKSYNISGYAIAGFTSMTKNGPGTLTLAGTNSYTGVTTINAGTLLVSGNSVACTNTLNVFNNAAFGGTGIFGGNVVVNPGGKMAPGGLNAVGIMRLTNMLSLNGGNLLFDLANSSGGTNDLLVVSNSLILNAVNSIFLTGGAPAGDYTLATYAATNGSGSLVLAAPYPNASLLVNSTSLVLHVGAGGATFGLTWKGTTSGYWEGDTNWMIGITATSFNNGDSVLFDDTLGGNSTISNYIAGSTVLPGSVTFNNNLTNYSIAANIGGNGFVAKFGSATVTLTGSNAYAGNTMINAGNLVVTTGGAINSPSATLNIGAVAGTPGTNTLAAGGAITVQSLLATNVVLAGAANSIFNFGGGTLTTSNTANAVAASILLASNASFTINGQWTMNGGIHTIASVQTNASSTTWGSVLFGNGVNNQIINVNSNAVWRLGNSAISPTNLALYVGYGAATNNQLWVNNGTLIVSNVQNGNTGGALTIGGSGTPNGNQMIVTNGGQVFLRNLGNNGIATLQIGQNGSSNSVTVIGANAAGIQATLNAGVDRIYVGSASSGGGNTLWVRQGGVITNSGSPFTWGANNFLIITNGGQFYSAGRDAIVGRQGTNSNFLVAGLDVAGNPAILNLGAGFVSVGGSQAIAGANGTNNYLWVGQGGYVTNANTYVGSATNAFGNALIITNGGQMNSSGNGVIGFYTNCNANWISIGGTFGTTNATWVNKGSLTIGGNAGATNNFAILFTGGVLTNVTSVILGGVNSKLYFNGGKLAAGANGYLIATNSGVINPAILVQNGGAILDSGSYTVTNQLPLIEDSNSTGGGLTKNGAGTNVLAGGDTYTGNTTVNAGTLIIPQATLATNSTVTVASGAKLNLGFTATNQVARFITNGVSKAPGIYNNSTDPTFLAGPGYLRVQPLVPPPGTNAYLTSLVLSPAGVLTPGFATNLFSYAVTEAYGSTPAITVTNADLNASNQLIYNNTTNPLPYGVASPGLLLNVNPAVTNVVKVQVTAQDGVTMQTYTVNIQQLPSQTQPALANSVNGLVLTLSWPLDHLGYRLLMQTNNLGSGISRNTNDWITVPNSTLTNQVSVPIDNIKTTEFYRLVFP